MGGNSGGMDNIGSGAATETVDTVGGSSTVVAAAGAAAIGGITGAGIYSSKDCNSMGGNAGATDNIGSGAATDAVGGKSGTMVTAA
jgi:hypothetical protein